MSSVLAPIPSIERSPGAALAGAGLSVWYGVTLFLSATLLFWVQPMVGKMLLPWLGGAPAVWNTCMVFFQAALLAGYAYAHWLSTRLSLRRQIPVHLGLLLVGAVFLPLSIPEQRLNSLSGTSSPAWWLLSSLALTVGWPFFILSSTAPLLQQWFSRSSHPQAKDPYFLYGASNLGSLLALLSYPLAVEPGLRLASQTIFWALGYGLLGILIAACGLRAGRHEDPEARAEAEGHRGGAEWRVDVTWGRRLGWAWKAFVPSSLLLGVTTFFTTDMGSMPLLWVIPLTLYLLTFVMAFARRPWLRLSSAAKAMAYGAVGVVFLLVTRTTEPAWLLVVVHLGFFFLAALVCHSRLAAERPEPRHLTEFYLWLSIGGVAGGIFNALLAPVLFRSVIEYPLAIVLAGLLMPRRSGADNPWRDMGWALGLAALVGLLGWMALQAWGGATTLTRLLVAGLPMVLVFAWEKRPLRFGLGLAAVLLSTQSVLSPPGIVVHVERNFFGVSRVLDQPADSMRRLMHGNTFHGRQSLKPGQQCLPLAYYHPAGPCGQIFSASHARPNPPRVAVIGLGSGSMVSHMQAGQEWTFYEIDPAVIGIAQNTNFFTFLSHCAQGPWQIVRGDARLKLREAPAHHYGLIVLDAFSSDAIPVHLLTREALALYRAKLAPGGLMAFHISNRYLDLEPVLGSLAADAAWVGRIRQDDWFPPSPASIGREPSDWAVLAQRKEDLGELGHSSEWQPLTSRGRKTLWTDDYSNLLGVFHWK